MFFTLLATVLFVYVLYLYLTANYGYWKKKQVPHNKPMLFFGTMKDMILMRKSIAQELHELYDQYKDVPYIGFYNLRTPGLLLTDIEDIQNVLNRDVQFFWKNSFTVDEEVDQIAAKSPFFLTGQKWKEARVKTGSLFSAAKMKQLTPFMVKATDKMNTYIENMKTCEGRDLMARYVADASALAAFGIEGYSFEDDNAFFRKLGQQVMEPDGFTGMKIMCLFLFPKVAKFFNIKFIPDDSVDYLKQTIATALKYRKDNNINPGDYLDILTKSKSDDFTDDDVLANAFGFFSDPNISIAGSLVLLELAKNLDIQEKLRKEIDMVLSNHGEILTNDAMQEMQYLDCVISETLRMYPPVAITMKQCTGYYEFPRVNKNQEIISLEPGMSVAVDVYKLHRNPKYFEDPDTFRPERFSEKNRGSIINGTYMPFGYGKRVCIGMKLAQIMLKVSIVDIVRNFEIKVNGRTKLPFQLDPKFVLFVNKGGLWFDFTKREISND